MYDEHVYRYPRRLTWPLELIASVIVGWSVFNVGRAGLLLLWERWPLDPFILQRVPQMRQLVAWLERSGPQDLSLQSLVMPLVWLLIALLLALFFRNLFPTVRFSMRGLLVSFAGDWVPVRWDGLRAIRVTEGADSKRFVVLVETEGRDLTSWHRLYSLLYGFHLRRGFLIGSMMEDGEGLLRELVNEVTRRRRLGEKLDVRMADTDRSFLFSLLVGGFGRGRSKANEKPVFQSVATPATMGSGAALTMPSMGRAVVPMPAPQPVVEPHPAAPPMPAAPVLGDDALQSDYPRVLYTVLNTVSVLILGFALWRYLAAWGTFLTFTFPGLRETALFRNVPLVPLVSQWGLLIGAHISLLLVAAVVLMLRHLFPAVAVDKDGVVLTAVGRSQRLRWDQISFVKATDVRAEEHVILIEAEGKSLPWYYIMGSWLYDGGTGRGALIWPMLERFEPVMQRIAMELTRQQAPDAPVKLRDDLPGWLLIMALRPAEALDRLVRLSAGDRDMPQGLEVPAVTRAALRMLWIAAGPAVLLLLYWMMFKGQLLLLQVPLMLVLAVLWGMTEWPLASFLASSLDQIVGAGNKGYQGLYLYPTSQLPRLLPLGLALLLTMMGFPTLAMFAWAAGIAWSGLLTAGLWEALYGWRGLPLLGGSIMTVVFQLLTFVGVLVLRG